MRFAPVLIALPFLLAFAGCATTGSKHAHYPHRTGQQNEFVMEYDDHGRAIGCSWYCGAPPIGIAATNTLRDGIYSYEVTNLHDTKKDTVWAAQDTGIGTKVSFAFDCTHEDAKERKENPLGIDRFSLINGFARTPALWAANHRVKTFRISFNGKDLGTFPVADTIKPQIVKLPSLTFPPGKKSTLNLEITEIYPGPAGADLCIADMVFDGFGVH